MSDDRPAVFVRTHLHQTKSTLVPGCSACGVEAVAMRDWHLSQALRMETYLNATDSTDTPEAAERETQQGKE